jgi:putative membrane protein insertion efficiency factor
MLISISPKISGQETNLLDDFCTHFEVEEHEHEFHVHTDYSNEIKTLGSVMFLFYKEFISSQDINACVFTPSCSVYAIESIKKKGIILGGMAALDRITRCNGLAYGYYDIEKETNLNIDPVE